MCREIFIFGKNERDTCIGCVDVYPDGGVIGYDFGDARKIVDGACRGGA